jgi:hypothetical protein
MAIQGNHPILVGTCCLFFNLFDFTIWTNKSKDIESTRNQFSVDYKYPLLRNKGGINDRLSADMAKISIGKNTLERLEAEENFILTKLERFIDLASNGHQPPPWKNQDSE